ncbi:MAG TPA: Hpt domain-containing protein [Azonexus sp.]|nr:Hpt domain-containing protein [Azonexus sp.]
MIEKFVLDREQILARLGGDEEIFSMMVDLYLQDVDNTAQSLAAALAEGEVETLIREAHTVKGLLATFSDDAGAAEAFGIEQQVKLGNLSGLQPAIAAVQQRLFEVAAVLRREVGRAG